MLSRESTLKVYDPAGFRPWTRNMKKGEIRLGGNFELMRIKVSESTININIFQILFDFILLFIKIYTCNLLQNTVNLILKKK